MSFHTDAICVLTCRPLPATEATLAVAAVPSTAGRQAAVVLVARAESALLRAGGRTVIGRTAEMLRRAGTPVDLVLLAPGLESLESRLESEIETWQTSCPLARVEAAGALLEADLTLLVEASVVYDKRLIELAASFQAPTRIVDSKSTDSKSTRKNDQQIGIGAYASAAVREQLEGGALDWSVPLGTGLEAADLDVESMPLYYRAIRRELRPFWLPIDDEGDLPFARKTLARAAGKGHMEWYVVLINRPVETFLSYYVGEWRVTPNQITAISNVTAYAATALLAIGWLWSALAFVVVTGILDGLDGRQARIQIKTSKVGEWEHVFDAISEVSWILALGWHMSSGLGESLYVGATAAWLAFYAADNYSYTFFRLRRGMMIDEVGPIDHAIRFVGSRRNTSFAYFAIALAIGYPREGYLVMIAFAGLTALAHWTRVAMLLSRPAPGDPASR